MRDLPTELNGAEKMEYFTGILEFVEIWKTSFENNTICLNYTDISFKSF